MPNRFVTSLFRFVIGVCFFSIIAIAHASDGKPVAEIKTDSYDFGEVFEGKDIIHDFIIKNTGDANLEIKDVKAGCGCTTVSFDRLISPGAEGKITVKFSTKGYIGKNSKAVRAETNDPANAKFNLKLTGEVKKFVTITPSKAILRGTVGEKISQVVTVAPGTKEPLTILHTSTLNKGDFRYSMKETKVDGKKAYEFLIENTRITAGQYMDKIFILTGKMDQNPVNIIVRGDIQEKVLLNNFNILD